MGGNSAPCLTSWFIARVVVGGGEGGGGGGETELQSAGFVVIEICKSEFFFFSLCILSLPLITVVGKAVPLPSHNTMGI